MEILDRPERLGIQSLPMNTQLDLTQRFEFPRIKDGRSVSGLVDSVKEPFDVEAKSKASASKGGVSQQQVKKEWSAKGDASRKLGMELHDYIASVVQGYTPDPIESLSDKGPHMHQFDRFWERAVNSFTPVWVEKTVTSAYYGVVGRIDTLVYNSQTGRHHVVDWKTGSFDGRGWNQLLAPFSDKRDSSLILGALQLGIYRLAIEQQLGQELGEGYLIFVSEDAVTARRVPDMRKRITKWLLQEVKHG